MNSTSVLWTVAFGLLLGLIALREVPPRHLPARWLTLVVALTATAAGTAIGTLVTGPQWLTYAIPVLAGVTALVLACGLTAVARRAPSGSPDPHSGESKAAFARV